LALKNTKHFTPMGSSLAWLLGVPAAILFPLVIGLDLLLQLSDWLGALFLAASLWFLYLAAKSVPPFTIDVDSSGVCDQFLGIRLRCLKWGQVEKIVKVRSFNGFSRTNNYFICGRGANAFSAGSLSKRISFSESISDLPLLKEALLREAALQHIPILFRDTSRRRAIDNELAVDSLDD
jgi:hypothetical protein